MDDNEYKTGKKRKIMTYYDKNEKNEYINNIINIIETLKIDENAKKNEIKKIKDKYDR